jgi:alkanesulfonate monooxygenase SsuD/methylene tetrahydromethanopterin reductase-like flavin-dependent oxidoreductase (luciferase family)
MAGMVECLDQSGSAFSCGPGRPDYRSWREAVLRAEDLGADILFGYDHFHAPAFEPFRR